MLPLLRSQFIEPFRHPKLAVTYLSLFLGLLSGSFIGVYAALDMVRLGFKGVVLYYECAFGLLGFVLFPLFFLLFRHFGQKVFLGCVIASQIGASLLLPRVNGMNDPILLGVLVALFAAGFWQMHHLALAAHTSAEESGFEVALAKVLTQIASILGSSLAGFAMLLPSPVITLIIAFVLTLLATLGLALTAPNIVHKNEADPLETQERGHVLIENFWSNLWRFPGQNIATALDAVQTLLFQTLLPVWLTLIGVGSVVIGLIRALQALVMAIVSAHGGACVKKGQGMEFRIGASSGVLGWLTACFSLSTPALLFSSGLCAVSSLFITTGLEARWYARRSARILVEPRRLKAKNSLTPCPASYPPITLESLTQTPILLDRNCPPPVMRYPNGRSVLPRWRLGRHGSRQL